MKNKASVFLITSFSLVLFALAGCYYEVIEIPINKTNTSIVPEYNSTPMLECVMCEQGETSWNGKACCESKEAFEQQCISSGGTVRFTDLHPIYTVMYGCFYKSEDAGASCAKPSDCSTGICDLESAINNRNCVYESAHITYDQPEQGQQVFYKCKMLKPGVCTDAPRNRTNPGGQLVDYEMYGYTLMETTKSGPIY